MCSECPAGFLLESDNQCFLLEKGNDYLIGRSSEHGKSHRYINLSDRSLDEEHCMLRILSCEDIFILDLLSDTGVTINGNRIEPLIYERVRPNEEFGIGDSKAQIKYIGCSALGQQMS
uniref:FHA domain-containing protein n=1 Tax=Glossina palpalis gambiensis TaxID=67801 RepID=A0A1B0ALB0_9MUSC